MGKEDNMNMEINVDQEEVPKISNYEVKTIIWTNVVSILS